METTDSSRQIYLRLLSYMRPYAKVFGIAILAMVLTAATEPAVIRPTRRVAPSRPTRSH